MTFQKAGESKDHEKIKEGLLNFINFAIKYQDGSYLAHKDIMQKLLDNYDNTALHVIGFIFDFNHEHLYTPIEIWSRRHNIKRFCFDKNHSFLDLFDQNEQTKKYPHFDFSIKSPKKLKNVKGESWFDICKRK